MSKPIIILSICFSISCGAQSNIDKIKDNISSSYSIEAIDQQKIISLIKPAIGVKTKSEIDKNITIGESKIGGKPDLPEKFDWPTYNNEPLAFCAQYNCKDLTIFDSEDKLPNEGMLYIFVYIDKEWPGFLNKKGSYKVIYIRDQKNLRRTEFPDTFFEEGRFKSASIEFFEYFTLPDLKSSKLHNLSKKYGNFNSFHQSTSDFIDKICGQSVDNYHQLLGEDRPVQGCVGYDFASNELNIRTMEAYLSKQGEIFQLAETFEILIQLDCNDSNTDLNKFGGSSVIYFGIKSEIIKDRDYENSVMVFQGT
ncbi:DUF1963 domain-containing protein [Aquimarina algiphila]|uniref:DUF1963 domain-containing protein n=1 Tax=Aquimarina algiphila TaxID=2047982 RepID=UPI00232E416D|nr:DUF1963 domain-containing protein [Aquimarina algiphila]